MYFTSTWFVAHLVEHPFHTGQRGVKTHKSATNTLSHRATRKNTQVCYEHPVTPGDAEWKPTSLLRTPCHTGRRGVKTHKSSKNTLLHRATRKNTRVFQEHPVTPGDAEWKHTSVVKTPCYTGRRGMKTHKSCNNTLLHRATRKENTQVL